MNNKKLKVLINALKLDEGKNKTLGGNFYHVYHFIKSIIELSELDIYVLVDEITHKYFCKIIPEEKLIFVGLKTNLLIKLIKIDYAISKIVKQYQFDVYHRPTGQLPFLPIAAISIATIADVNFTKIKMNFIRKLYKYISYKSTIKRADHIISISNFTRNELINNLNCPVDKVSVVYHGTNNLPDPAFRISEKYNQFWITFGHQAHKNVETCIYALQRFNEKYQKKHKLLVIGQNDFYETQLKLIVKQNNLEDNIVFLGSIDSRELHGLYIKAHGLLFLSLYEGFGMPVLEAMNVGCPVICSNVCSLPEVCNDAGIQVEPFDYNYVSDMMNHLLGKDRKEIINRGYKQAQKFSWSKAAKETMKIYYNA